MKKFAVTLLLFTFSNTLIYAQIPDPNYNKYNYLDTGLTKKPYQHAAKFQPRILFGLGQFNFNGDISDTRDNGLTGRTGMQFGLTTNINDFLEAGLVLEEGIVRVDGIDEDDLPKNFMSTLNSIGIRLSYDLKSICLFNF